MADENLKSMLEEERAGLIEEIAQILTLRKRKKEVITFYKKHPFQVFFDELEKNGLSKKFYSCSTVCLVILLLTAIIFTSFASELEGTHVLALIWGGFWILFVILAALTVSVIAFLIINVKKYNISIVKNDEELEKCYQRLSEINQETGYSDEETERAISNRRVQMEYMIF